MAGAYRPGAGADLAIRCLCRLLLARYGLPGLGSWGKDGPVAEPVLLISSDPFLGASLEALAGGRVRVARLDPSQRHAAWPGEPAATVVLDVTAGQRQALHDWVRRHHRGPLVVLLKPGERAPSLPPDPDRVVVGRPFRMADLVWVLEQAPPPRPDPPPDRPDPPGDRPDPPGDRPDPPAGPRAPTDLLQASAEQRRRRLGSLTAAPRPAGPTGATTNGLPRPDWPTAATRLPAPRRRPAGRGRRVAGQLLVVVLVLLILAGAWLALGLFEARRDLQVGATAVRSELATAETAWAAGHDGQAAQAVAAAERSLEVAATVGDRRELRIVAHLPLLSRNADDSRRLLAELRAELERTRGALDLRG
jgi:hypothetical protein